MDRRTFLSGVGAAGTVGVVATGLVAKESNAVKARAAGLARAAGMSGAIHQTAASDTKKAPTADGVVVGYLTGSATWFASRAAEQWMRANAVGAPWTKWDVATAAQINSQTARFRVSRLVDVSIGVLQNAGIAHAAASSLKSLDIIAHFAIDDAPYFAQFNAWHREASTQSKRQIASTPLTFSAMTPNGVALEVNYALNAAAVAGGISSAGKLYLPIGAQAASDAGLATGLYVLAMPSVITGVRPDLGTYVFSGDVHAPLADPSGHAPDFDYVTLAIRLAAV